MVGLGLGGLVLLAALVPAASGPSYDVEDNEPLKAVDAAMREVNRGAPWMDHITSVDVGFGGHPINVHTDFAGSESSVSSAIAICEAFTSASPVNPAVMVWGVKPSLEIDGSDTGQQTKLANTGGNALVAVASEPCVEVTDLTDPDRSGD